jgi:hypothetical protein
MNAKALFVVGTCCLASSTAAARPPTPECQRAREERADHQAGCRQLEQGCAGGDRTACRSQQGSCGTLDDARLVDAVYAACGQPEPQPSVRPAAQEPPAVGTSQRTGSTDAGRNAKRDHQGGSPRPRHLHVRWNQNVTGASSRQREPDGGPGLPDP